MTTPSDGAQLNKRCSNRTPLLYCTLHATTLTNKYKLLDQLLLQSYTFDGGLQRIYSQESVNIKVLHKTLIALFFTIAVEQKVYPQKYPVLKVMHKLRYLFTLYGLRRNNINQSGQDKAGISETNVQGEKTNNQVSSLSMKSTIFSIVRN